MDIDASQLKCSDCEHLGWTDPPRNEFVEPAKDIIMVVLDCRNMQGAIYIRRRQNHEHVDKVGPVKGEDNMVMVPWQSKWCYEPIGSARVAHIQKISY